MTASAHSGTSQHYERVIRTPTLVLGSLLVLMGVWGTAGCFSDPTNNNLASSDTPASSGTPSTASATEGSGEGTSSATATTSDTVDTTTTSGTGESSEGSSDGSTGTCSLGVCTMPECGDGTTDEAEQCDDGNDEDGDGCDNDCSYTEIQIDAGGNQTCALIEGGRVRCWGDNRFGQLGYGNTQNVGDNESPWEVGDIQLPAGA